MRRRWRGLRRYWRGRQGRGGWGGVYIGVTKGGVGEFLLWLGGYRVVLIPPIFHYLVYQ